MDLVSWRLMTGVQRHWMHEALNVSCTLLRWGLGLCRISPACGRCRDISTPAYYFWTHSILDPEVWEWKVLCNLITFLASRFNCITIGLGVPTDICGYVPIIVFKAKFIMAQMLLVWEDVTQQLISLEWYHFSKEMMKKPLAEPQM